MFAHLGEALSIVAHVWLSSATWLTASTCQGVAILNYTLPPLQTHFPYIHACCPPELAYGPRFEARIVRLVTLFMKVKPTLLSPPAPSKQPQQEKNIIPHPSAASFSFGTVKISENRLLGTGSIQIVTPMRQAFH